MFAKIATMIAVSVAAGSILETAALAQPSLTPPARARRPHDRKSEDTATWLAVAGTAIPLGLFALGARGNAGEASEPLVTAGLIGFVIGPSAGHFYATENVGAPGMVIRASGGLVGLVGMGVLVTGALSCTDFGPPDSAAPCDNNESEGKAILGASVAIMVGGAIYDIATASSTARRVNARRFALAPTLLRSNNQAPTVGLALSGAF